MQICVYFGVDYLMFIDVICKYLKDVKISCVNYVVIVIVNLVDGDQVMMINYDWSFLIEVMCCVFGFDMLLVVNDFIVFVMVLLGLIDVQCVQIGGGMWCQNSVIGLFGLGMGFGVLGLILVDDCWIVFGSEGGYVLFVLQDECEDLVLQYVCKKFLYVLFECVCVGFGMEIIYCVFVVCDKKCVVVIVDMVEIVECVYVGDVFVFEMVECFCGIFGVFVGSVVLMFGVFGGVYIGGGVVLKLGELFMCLLFCVCFEVKGCFMYYFENILIYLIIVEYLVFFGVLVIFVEQLLNCFGGVLLVVFEWICQMCDVLMLVECCVVDFVLNYLCLIINDLIVDIVCKVDVSQLIVICFCCLFGCQGLLDFKLKFVIGFIGMILMSYSQVYFGDMVIDFGVKVFDNMVFVIL